MKPHEMRTTALQALLLTAGVIGRDARQWLLNHIARNDWIDADAVDLERLHRLTIRHTDGSC
jgi:hypothetical protein